MGRSLVHMDDSGEDILLSNTLRNEVKRRLEIRFCYSGGTWVINSGEAGMSGSTIITLSFLVLHPASATLRFIPFLCVYFGGAL